MIGDAFHRKRIKRPARVVNTGAAPSQQPKSPGAIDVAGVAGAMPSLAIDAELRFFIPLTVQITGHDVFPADHDLTGLSGAKRQAFELLWRERAQWLAPSIADNS